MIKSMAIVIGLSGVLGHMQPWNEGYTPLILPQAESFQTRSAATGEFASSISDGDATQTAQQYSGPNPIQSVQMPLQYNYPTATSSQPAKPKSPKIEFPNNQIAGSPSYSGQPKPPSLHSGHPTGTGCGSTTLQFTTPPKGYLVSEDGRCQDLWSEISSLLEATLDEHPESPHFKALEALRRLLEELGGPTLIDGAAKVLGSKGQRKVLHELDKFSKRIQQLGKRKNLLMKHPEYTNVLNIFNSEMESLEVEYKSTRVLIPPSTEAIVNPAIPMCYQPASLVKLLINSIAIDEETEHQLVAFEEPIKSIVEEIVKAAKLDKKRKKGKKNHTEVFEKSELQELEKFLNAIKRTRGHSKGSGGDDEGNMPIFIIVGVLVAVIVIAVVIGLVLVLKRK